MFILVLAFVLSLPFSLFSGVCVWKIFVKTIHYISYVSLFIYLLSVHVKPWLPLDGFSLNFILGVVY
jgi:hypothetical protein